MPSSTAFVSVSMTAGRVESVHRLHGHVCGGGMVVNDHAKLAASGLPARSFTRGSARPPLTIAVYMAELASVPTGRRIALPVALL
jgi:hypothetical protein